MAELILPNESERIAIVGRTGSGKTQAAIWQLSRRDWDKKPWVIFNFKGDALIDDLPGTQDLDIRAAAPKNPGLYIVRPLPDEKEEVDSFLFRCWKQENIGLYADEGYMLTGLKYFRACLTQGRSKHIPMIVLSQRPRWIDTFVWSESDYLQAFHLTREDDRDTIETHIPGYTRARLEPYWSLWHDEKRNQTLKLQPVPTADELLRTFKDRLPNRTRILA